ncbi:hypothetical protein C6P45_002676 [Maudiozyma exigua]|uniref:Uncharacterized protein n=1 Tax=Maudiozyma exigua TaxID=34358 RepID=A0A9P7BAN6_MAUEX|nr:hypothetical protein C6P45_002676 [Kazachstania exigua]
MAVLVDKFIVFTNITDVREKLLRWLQFFIVFISIWFPQSTIPLQLKAQILIIRKVLRCFKPLQHANTAYKHCYSTNIDYLFILKNICFMLYLGADQIVLLRMLNLISKNNFSLVQVPRFANIFWLTALSIDIRMNLNIIKKLDDKKLDKGASSQDKTQKKIVTRTRFISIRKIIWDILDTYIVSTYLQYMKSNSILIGIFGIITSTLAMQDIWNKC